MAEGAVGRAPEAPPHLEQPVAVDEERKCIICHSTHATGPAGAADALVKPCNSIGCGHAHTSCFFRWMLRRADLRQDPYTCSVCLSACGLPEEPVVQLLAAGVLCPQDWARLERLRRHPIARSSADEEPDDPLERWLLNFMRLIRLELIEDAEAAEALAAAEAEDDHGAAQAGAALADVGNNGQPAGAVAIGQGVQMGQAVLVGGAEHHHRQQQQQGGRPARRQRRLRLLSRFFLPGTQLSLRAALLALAAAAGALAIAAVAIGQGAPRGLPAGRSLLQAVVEDAWGDESLALFNS